MSDKENLFFKGADTSKKLVKSTVKGSRMIVAVVLGGLALGLGIGAYNSASGGS